MKLIFAGSGSAFATGQDNFHSNMLLESATDHRLLIDCGSDARLSLAQLGYSHRDIDSVYISHLHADHAGGLEWLGLHRKFSTNSSRPILHIEPELINPLWENVLSGGMSCLETERAELETFFAVRPIVNHQFHWDKLELKTIKTVHIYNDGELLPTFGLFFTVNNHKILITTDTQFYPDLYRPYYEEADWIFQDCETAQKPSGVHAHYHDLVNLDSAIKAKMWLYHYNSTHLPDAEAGGFLGFVKRGQSFDLDKLAT